MTDKHTKRVKQYVEDLLEERDDLFTNIGKLISTVRLKVQDVSKSPTSLSEKEALLTYLTKTLVLFSELNHSVLKSLETVEGPISTEANSTLLETGSNIQVVQDYFKEDQTNIGQIVTSSDLYKEGPKVPNGMVQNESYLRMPLDDTTLKAICSSFINSYSSINNSDNTLNASKITANTDNKTSLIQQQENTIVLNPRVSPTLSYCSESDVFSTVSSSTYQHPLVKYGPPTEIPKQYDSHDLDKVKENMKYISRKMGFDSEGFARMTSQFDKALPANFQFEEPVRDVQNETLDITKRVEHFQGIPPVGSEGTNTFQSSSEETNANKLNNESPQLSKDLFGSLNIQNIAGPSRSTGAIRKQKLAPEDFMEFSTSTSESESCEKVSSWLTQKSHENKTLISSTESDISENLNVQTHSAAEKLGETRRYDRNEEAREKARADMPDLKLIPVEAPQVIKNDLNLNCGLEKTNRNNNGIKTKVKDLNRKVAVYEIQKMDVPQVGAICVFSHIVSPSEFYLQILNDVNSAFLDTVSENLDKKFSKTESKFRSKHEAFTKLGKFCYGYIWGEKKTWHRLQVLDWKLGCSSDEVHVQSVDYGFTCTTMYTYLRELTTDLAHIPMLAVKCHFPMLHPPGSTFSNRLAEWPSSTTEALYDIANISRDLTAVPRDINMYEIVFAMLDGDSVGVDLVQFPEADAETLGRLLTDMGLATEIFDDYAEHSELGTFLEDIDELERADNLNEFLLGYDAKDEVRICRFTRKDGTCYKGKHCKLEHIELKDGYTTDKTAVFHMAINDLIFPNKGDTVQVLVTTYVDSCTYLVQIIKNPVKMSNSIIMDKDIADLMDAMNHPKIIAQYAPFKILPAIGEVILAFNPIARKWVRVAVRDLNKNGGDVIEVYSLDFGEEFLVTSKNIRMMKEEFMHLPFQIIQIYLDKFQHRNGCDKKKSMKFFDHHMFYKTFLAHIKSSDLPYKVSLTTYKGRDIGPTLVKAGFAEKRTIDIHISEDREKRRKLDLE